MPRTKPLLAGTVVPVVIGLAIATGGGHAAAGTSAGETPAATPQHQNPGGAPLRFVQPLRTVQSVPAVCGSLRTMRSL